MSSSTPAALIRLENRLRSWISAIREEVSQPAIAIVLGVVLAFNVVADLGIVRRNLAVIGNAQLVIHRLLCSLSPRSVTAKWVRVVPIDDRMHGVLGEPTNRAYLAKLIDNIVAGEAFTIVLDVRLVAPEGKVAGQDLARRVPDNRMLLDAVRRASIAGVPVVLATWLEPGAGHTFTRMPNVFLMKDLPLASPDGSCRPAAAAAPSAAGTKRPACARIGNINLPNDKRRIPLVTKIVGSERESPSLALEAVSAYEEVMHREPRTVDKPVIAGAIARHAFPFGSFIPEAGFQTIAIEPLARGAVDALALCRGRIVVIGGIWRRYAGRGETEDTFATPVGDMRGMYLHANYIEALLDDRYARQVPLSIALVFDFLVGAWLYVSFHRASRGWDQLRLLLIPGALLVASYVMFANLNVYLDFILPLGACFAHLGIEYVRDYVKLRTEAGAPRPAAQPARPMSPALKIGLLLAGVGLLILLVVEDRLPPTSKEGGGVARLSPPQDPMPPLRDAQAAIPDLPSFYLAHGKVVSLDANVLTIAPAPEAGTSKASMRFVLGEGQQAAARGFAPGQNVFLIVARGKTEQTPLIVQSEAGDKMLLSREYRALEGDQRVLMKKPDSVSRQF